MELRQALSDNQFMEGAKYLNIKGKQYQTLHMFNWHFKTLYKHVIFLLKMKLRFEQLAPTVILKAYL